MVHNDYLWVDKAGIWGPATSTIDWCEENYAVCKYIAEFWNTTTNIAFFALALFGVHKVRATGQETRFLLCYLGMITVGMGSWLFHMTLKYEWQLADELPMIYCTGVCVYCAFKVNNKSGIDGRVLLFVLGYSAVVTIVYLQVRDPVFHQVAYAVEIFIIIAVSMIRQAGIRNKDPHAYANLKSLFLLGIWSFGLSFVLWNIDNIFCTQLRKMRNWLPPAFSPLLQLHAYWHIGSGFGCYAAIVYQQYLRLVLLGSIDKYRLRKLFSVIPYIDAAHKSE